MAERTESDRFWAKVDKNGPVPEHRPALGPCWLWTAWINPNGYGYFGKTTNAHRWAWVDANGPVPEGLHLDHLCRVTHCVRPGHLEAVTCRENVIVRGRGPTAKNASKTHCVNGHPFSGENLYLRRGGGRDCRACQAASKRRYRRERKESP